MLTELLDRMAAERGGVLGVEPKLVIDPDESWTPVTELVREPYTLLGQLVDATAARWNAPRHVGAALLWKTYSYWHTMPMALGWALDGRMPVMRLADTYFKVSEAGVTIAATRVTLGRPTPRRSGTCSPSRRRRWSRCSARWPRWGSGRCGARPRRRSPTR